MKQVLTGLALILAMSQAYADASCTANVITVGDDQGNFSSTVSTEVARIFVDYKNGGAIKDFALCSTKSANGRNLYSLKVSANGKNPCGTQTLVKQEALAMALIQTDNDEIMSAYVNTSSKKIDFSQPSHTFSNSKSFARSMDVVGIADKAIINVNCTEQK